MRVRWLAANGSIDFTLPLLPICRPYYRYIGQAHFRSAVPLGRTGPVQGFLNASEGAAQAAPSIVLPPSHHLQCLFGLEARLQATCSKRKLDGVAPALRRRSAGSRRARAFSDAAGFAVHPIGRWLWLNTRRCMDGTDYTPGCLRTVLPYRLPNALLTLGTDLRAFLRELSRCAPGRCLPYQKRPPHFEQLEMALPCAVRLGFRAFRQSVAA